VRLQTFILARIRKDDQPNQKIQPLHNKFKKKGNETNNTGFRKVILFQQEGSQPLGQQEQAEGRRWLLQAFQNQKVIQNHHFIKETTIGTVGSRLRTEESQKQSMQPVWDGVHEWGFPRRKGPFPVLQILQEADEVQDHFKGKFSLQSLHHYSTLGFCKGRRRHVQDCGHQLPLSKTSTKEGRTNRPIHR